MSKHTDTSQKVAKYLELLAIEKELAAGRKKSGKPGDKGRAKTIAAKAAGLGSATTADVAAKTYMSAMRLRDQGRTEEADKIIAALDGKPVVAAAREASEATGEVVPPKPPKPPLPDHADKAVHALRILVTAIDSMDAQKIHEAFAIGRETLALCTVGTVQEYLAENLNATLTLETPLLRLRSKCGRQCKTAIEGAKLIDGALGSSKVGVLATKAVAAIIKG